MKILKRIGIIIGVIIGLVILYLVLIIFTPILKIEMQPLPASTMQTQDSEALFTDSRKDVNFSVEGENVSAWLYLAENLSSPVPCIVMNHGFGGTKDMALERYAHRFLKAGFSVLTYDYRHFGESEGEPRQHFSFESQLADCRGAIAYARSVDEIDPRRIAVWGTSAGGGYGLALAAQDKQIACICAQCAGLDAKEDEDLAVEREGIGFFLRLFMHAQRDKGRSRFGLSPHKIPIVGKPGTTAMLTAPGAFEGYARLVSPDFINEICPRAILTSNDFNPIDYAKDVKCPVLIQICENDNLVSMSGALNTVDVLGEWAEVKKYPIGHFDIYFGDHFEKAVEDQITFFKTHM